jgi:hypothetical protein
MKKQKVRYEFYNFQSTSLDFSTTLVLNNPASVKFICTDSNLSNAKTIINNVYVLQGLVDFTNGTAFYPYELILDNNENEIDVANYTIKLQPNSELQVVAKYYVND